MIEEKDFTYDIIQGVDWLNTTNLVIDWVACSLELTLGAKLHTIPALSVNSIANVTLSSLKQVLAEVKCGCLAWFGLLHPHSLLDTKGVFAVLWGGRQFQGTRD